MVCFARTHCNVDKEKESQRNVEQKEEGTYEEVGVQEAEKKGGNRRF